MNQFLYKKTTLDNAYLVFILFIIISVATRFFSFFPSIIDHDESTYLVIASSILDGGVLYEDVIDIKPVGIFYLVAGFIKIFGTSIFLFRFFVALIIAGTSFFIYKIQRTIGYSNASAFASGIIYILFLSVWTQYGAGPNTEHFYVFFTALALWMFSKNNTIYSLFGSLILGIGFLIKVVVMFDFTAFMLYFIIHGIYHKKSLIRLLVLSFFCGLVFLLPFGIVNYSFFITDHYESFSQMHYQTFGSTPKQHQPLKMLIWMLSFFGRFLPISLLLFMGLSKKPIIDKKVFNEKMFYLIWFGFSIFSVLLPGGNHGHYTIQLMLPITLAAGIIFDNRHSKPKSLATFFQKKIGYTLLALFFIINSILMYKDHCLIKDYPREISTYLKSIMEEGETIYTGNAPQIIYYLLDKPSPTPYVHRSLLYSETHLKTLQIDQNKELAAILNKLPDYVLERKTIEVEIVQSILKEEYELLKYFKDADIKVFKRK